MLGLLRLTLRLIWLLIRPSSLRLYLQLWLIWILILMTTGALIVDSVALACFLVYLSWSWLKRKIGPPETFEPIMTLAEREAARKAR